ncbi:alpha/beta hydrolase [Streptomyces sp. NPDC018019]|uniref:alpha/beta hydrolase n=1 Tax=Streptomyces sp. NPDC018019 TaxID=3365030 RepID=UPI00378F5D38
MESVRGADGSSALTGRGRHGGDIAVRLPNPTGPYPVGVVELYLVDRGRRDPWGEIAVREVVVSVFYPAGAVRGCVVGRQLPGGAAKLFGQVMPVVRPGLPKSGVDWAGTATHAYAGAPVLDGRWPVLLYSPGGGDPRGLGTCVAEETASRGWVVVCVDHPGDAVAVEFPVGRAGRELVRTTAFRGDPRADAAVFRTMVGARVEDVRFVLRELEEFAAGRGADAAGRTVPKGLGRALDLGRVGVYGHSAGGTTAAQVMYEDRRIGAAVNWEGFLDQAPAASGQAGELLPVARYGVDRPLLLVGTDGFPKREEMARSWSAMLAHPGGRTRQRRIRHAAHWVFTDYAAMVPQLQAAGLMTAEARRRLVGAVGPEVSVPAVRRSVRAFFARWLPPR